MISIVSENKQNIAEILNPVAKIEGIPEMQKSIKTLQRYISKNNGDVGALKLGVEGVYYALWPLVDLKKLWQRGWCIQEKDTSGGRSPILTVSDFRGWLMDDDISWEEITETFDGLVLVGKEVQGMLDNHKEEDELNRENPKVGYVKVVLPGNGKILRDLCIGGTKGGEGRNNYGPFEKVLAVMLQCERFPKDGKDGEGDVSYGSQLIEVKSVNNNKLQTQCKVPHKELGFTSGCLLLVRTNVGVTSINKGATMEILCFRNQKLLNTVMRHNRLKNPRTQEFRKYIFDKRAVDAVFDKQGQLSKAILYRARVPLNKSNATQPVKQVQQQTPDDADEYEVTGDGND